MLIYTHSHIHCNWESRCPYFRNILKKFPIAIVYIVITYSALCFIDIVMSILKEEDAEGSKARTTSKMSYCHIYVNKVLSYLC